MKAFNTDQGRLNFIWWFDHGHVSTGGAGGGAPPLSPPSGSSGLEGVLDPSFGTSGFNTTTPGTPAQINAIVLQPDGKIVAGGDLRTTGAVFALARYNVNGTLDTTFGTNGFVTSPTPGTTGDTIHSLALQLDGKIIAGGSAGPGSGSAFAIGRYNSDGTIDTSFGTNGFNITSPGTSDVIYSVVIQSDGKIIAGGQANVGVGGNFVFTLARYNSNGSLDTTFGTNGFITSPTPSDWDIIRSIVLQPDGKIVAGGIANSLGDNIFVLARYHPDGTIDTSFGPNGFSIITPPGKGDEIHSVVLQPDGKIVAVGYADISGAQSLVVGRYNYDGSLDTAFGTNGFNINTPGSYDGLESVALQSDGKILAGGIALGTNDTLVLVRYNSDGSLDTTFGTNGFVLDSPGTDDSIMSIAIQSDGKVVAGGYATMGGNAGFVVARYQ